MRGWQWASAVMALSLSVTAYAADKPFDPTRDSTRDLHAAMEQAQKEHKNILMDVGGNWCGWCLVLDRMLHEDPDLHSLLARNYVLLHVNFSKENENLGFLKAYPKRQGTRRGMCFRLGESC